MTNRNHTATRRFAPVPLAAGLAMTAMSLAAIADRLDIRINMALAAGCALVLVGVTWITAAIAHARRSAAGSSELSVS